MNRPFASIRRGAAALLCACALMPLAHANPAFDTWAENFSADWVRLSPERATFTQLFSSEEQRALDSRLTPLTDASRLRQLALARRGLAELGPWLAGPLTAAQREGALTMRWGLARAVAAEPFADHEFIFNQGGLHVRLVNLLTENQPLRRAADLPAYLSRLAQVPERLDEGIARARRAAERKLLPPRFIVERARAQLETFLAPAPEQNVFVTALAMRTAALADLTPEVRERALADAKALVADKVRPAYERVAAFLAELQPRTGAEAGLVRLPDGLAAYAQALSNYTTTTLSADEIHAIGLREVARIEAEMDRLLRERGLRDGSVNSRVEALRLSLQPPAEPDPRPQLLARYAEMVRDNQRRSRKLFNLQPRAPVEVRREPLLTERTASAHYSTPAPDGSRPGIFWVPLPGPIFNIPGMRSLAVHEAVPGHHFQLAVQQETADLPRWRRLRIFGGGSAHSEGWALYAERLAIEQGWYDGDAVGLLGALDGQLFRARRLVVDTGMHALGWSRERAIAYGISAQEIERYVSNPGQACAYMIGMLRIIALRDEAHRALGEKFTLPALHDVVLRAGSVPLDVLGDLVRAWVTEKRAGLSMLNEGVLHAVVDDKRQRDSRGYGP